MGVTRGRASGAGGVVVARYRAPWTRQGQRLLIAGMLSLLATALLLLADAAGAVPVSLLPHTPLHARNAHAALSNPGASPSPSQTSTAAPTATSQPAAPPVITLVSPSAGQGPVGAHISIKGHDFSGSTATIFAASQQDCSGSQGTLVTPKISGGSFGTTTFIWPTNLSNSTYYICADGLTSGAPSYQVLASGPPTLSLSVSTASAGDSVTITGSNFVGYASGTNINITESSGRAPLTLTGATLGPDGSFSVTETLSKTIIGNNVTINAYSPPEVAGLQPVLQASASLTVQNVTPTTTVAVTPTLINSGGAPSTTTSTDQKSGNAGLIVLLIVGIVLALLVILGVVAYLVLRGRNGGEPGAAGDYPGGDGFGGYDGASGQRSTGPVPGYGQSATGRYSQVNPFGRSGVFDTPNAYTEPFGGPPVGGVSQWDEPPTSPGPDWQPRPMTGYGPADSDTQANSYDQYPDYPGAPQQPIGQSAYPPIDPWDVPANQSPLPGRSSGPGYPPNSNLGGNTGRTRATGPTRAPAPQPDEWGNGPADDGWGGSGVTRPGNQRDQSPGNEPGW